MTLRKDFLVGQIVLKVLLQIGRFVISFCIRKINYGSLKRMIKICSEITVNFGYHFWKGLLQFLGSPSIDQGFRRRRSDIAHSLNSFVSIFMIGRFFFDKISVFVGLSEQILEKRRVQSCKKSLDSHSKISLPNDTIQPFANLDHSSDH